MAATKARPRAPASRNGTVRKTTRASAARPALAAGAAAAGLAGGMLIGSRKGSGLFRRKRSGTALAIAGAKRFAAAAGKASNTADDIRAIREQLENANRRSPIEVVLDGLTHRPGTGKRERGFG
jgi:hypothetical protein